MKLEQLITSIKEDKLSKEQLEQYEDRLVELFAEMQLEMAELEKEEALFMERTDATVARAKVLWKATDKGQRLIVIKRYSEATKKLINSVKSRIFRLIY